MHVSKICAHPEGSARWCAPSSHSSCELLDPSFHAFHSGAPTHRLCSKTLNQCGLGRSFSLRICTRIWLHTHAHTHIHSQYCRCCWWEGSLILLAVRPSSLLLVLPLCDISGLNSAGQPEKFNSLAFVCFFCVCKLIQLSQTLVCHISYVNCDCLRAALNLNNL